MCNRYTVTYHSRQYSESIIGSVKKVKKVTHAGLFDWMADIGGFSKAVSLIGTMFGSCLLRRQMDKEIGSLDPDVKNIVSYERIVQMSKQLKEIEEESKST